MLRSFQGGIMKARNQPQLILLLVGGLTASAVALAVRARNRLASTLPRPPRAAKRPHRVKFGKVDGENRGKNPMDPPLERTDDYFWMRDDTRESKEVIDHIRKENKYTEASMEHLKGLKGDLYEEFLSHLKESDANYPYRHGNWYYYTRTEKGMSYSFHCRSKEVQGIEEVILDENNIAVDKEFCDIRTVAVCPVTHSIVAYAVDLVGNEVYSIHFRDIELKNDLDDVVQVSTGDLTWGADSSTIFYTTQAGDEELRPDKLWLHTLGTSKDEDILLYTEEDRLFELSVGKSDSERFIMASSHSSTTTEERFIDLKGVEGAEAHRNLKVQLLSKRQEGVRYEAEHSGDKFYIVTNKDGCKNSKLVSTPLSSAGSSSWTDVRPYEPKVSLSGVTSFRDYLVLHGREGGLAQAWVIDLKRGGREHRIEHPDDAYCFSLTGNYVYDTDVVRFSYQSMVAPKSIVDYNMETRKRTLLKEKEVPNYDRNQYTCSRILATSRDGTKIPMSAVYRRDIFPDGIKGADAPCMMYGYGSYGYSIEPTFNYMRVSYLDRGMIYVIAHIRGGGEMGRTWYEDHGKFLTKRNTFQDFLDCAEHLVADGATSPSKLACCGRSAGGLLMGNVVNMRPDLFAAVVADVPFVDIMNIMCDSSVPLTVIEWEEWGNPNEVKYFDYMLSYSPYDNVREQPYPAMLVTGGFHDPRVAYWEPLKWVAKLRELKTNNNPLYLKIDMVSGHFSASDRYKQIKEMAQEYAFILSTLGCTEIIPFSTP
ncbi:unnamed protein product [Discosporangium mesarthrocarpum]